MIARRWTQIASFAALIVLIAAGACYLTVRMLDRPGERNPVDYHYWIHTQLELTPEQDKALEAVEETFAKRQRTLRARIVEGNAELADAIETDKTDSPRVQAATAKIHDAHGELQKAVLEHVFAMRSALTPEQYDRLLASTARALRSSADSP